MYKNITKSDFIKLKIMKRFKITEEDIKDK